MITGSLSRRAFTLAAGSLVAASAARSAPGEPSAETLGVTGANAAIHQEVVFKATPERLYHVLTDAEQFDKVVLLSGAIQAMALKAAPCRILAEPGGAFSLFGGYITGRQLALSPGERIVQAWRSASWPPHIYSIVRFEFAPHPEGVKLAFDHTGFPNEEAVSLANGWREHYWGPLAKVLA